MHWKRWSRKYWRLPHFFGLKLVARFAAGSAETAVATVLDAVGCGVFDACAGVATVPRATTATSAPAVRAMRYMGVPPTELKSVASPQMVDFAGFATNPQFVNIRPTRQGDAHLWLTPRQVDRGHVKNAHR